ncbi:unnamed protein product [Moneuplotes crassus]|uniref:Uncharacterized protein n=1 Tax=Euplotes crassus TaxID=5936 RepID=A0AAD1XEX4_EUPCR|nr:unnamed protein product [Moneuplotes crassus]
MQLWKDVDKGEYYKIDIYKGGQHKCLQNGTHLKKFFPEVTGTLNFEQRANVSHIDRNEILPKLNSVENITYKPNLSKLHGYSQMPNMLINKNSSTATNTASFLLSKWNKSNFNKKRACKKANRRSMVHYAPDLNKDHDLKLKNPNTVLEHTFQSQQKKIGPIHTTQEGIFPIKTTQAKNNNILSSYINDGISLKDQSVPYKKRRTSMMKDLSSVMKPSSGTVFNRYKKRKSLVEKVKDETLQASHLKNMREIMNNSISDFGSPNDINPAETEIEEESDLEKSQRLSVEKLKKRMGLDKKIYSTEIDLHAKTTKARASRKFPIYIKTEGERCKMDKNRLFQANPRASLEMARRKEVDIQMLIKRRCQRILKIQTTEATRNK